jgi:putative transposase
MAVPRTARVVVAAAPRHVTQRGNNRQQTFFSDAQRRRYLTLLGQYSRLHELRILGYCLMPNHVHLIAAPGREDALAKAVGRADNAYSRYLNKLRGRSGHLWQNRFYSMPMERDHVVRALRYVDMNPVRARLIGSTGRNWDGPVPVLAAFVSRVGLQG